MSPDDELAVRQAVVDLRDRMLDRFRSLEQRLDQREQMSARVQERMEGLSSDVSALQGISHRLEREVNELRKAGAGHDHERRLNILERHEERKGQTDQGNRSAFKVAVIAAILGAFMSGLSWTAAQLLLHTH